jgi:hypothetical protein
MTLVAMTGRHSFFVYSKTRASEITGAVVAKEEFVVWSSRWWSRKAMQSGARCEIRIWEIRNKGLTAYETAIDAEYPPSGLG